MFQNELTFYIKKNKTLFLNIDQVFTLLDIKVMHETKHLANNPRELQYMFTLLIKFYVHFSILFIMNVLKIVLLFFLGYVNTGLYRNLEGTWGKLNQLCAVALYRTPEEGIQTILHCLASKEVEKDTGRLFRDCYPRPEPKISEKLVGELWDRTEALIQSKDLKFELLEEEEEEEQEEKEQEQDED